MKQIFIATVALFFTVAGVHAQNQKVAPKMPMDATTKLITYTDVVEMAGTKDELYGKALAWCNTYFKNPADVIREKNMEEGSILCKARYKISNPPDKKGFSTDAGVVQYTLKLAFKEGKYKYTITEINWKQTSYYPCEKWMDTTSKQWLPEFDFYLQQVNEQSKAIAKDMEKSMKATAVIKKDDW